MLQSRHVNASASFRITAPPPSKRDRRPRGSHMYKSCLHFLIFAGLALQAFSAHKIMLKIFNCDIVRSWSSIRIMLISQLGKIITDTQIISVLDWTTYQLLSCVSRNVDSLQFSPIIILHDQRRRVAAHKVYCKLIIGICMARSFKKTPNFRQMI